MCNMQTAMQQKDDESPSARRQSRVGGAKSPANHRSWEQAGRAAAYKTTELSWRGHHRYSTLIRKIITTRKMQQGLGRGQRRTKVPVWWQGQENQRTCPNTAQEDASGRTSAEGRPIFYRHLGLVGQRRGDRGSVSEGLGISAARRDAGHH